MEEWRPGNTIPASLMWTTGFHRVLTHPILWGFHKRICGFQQDTWLFLMGCHGNNAILLVGIRCSPGAFFCRECGTVAVHDHDMYIYIEYPIYLIFPWYSCIFPIYFPYICPWTGTACGWAGSHVDISSRTAGGWDSMWLGSISGSRCVLKWGRRNITCLYCGWKQSCTSW